MYNMVVLFLNLTGMTGALAPFSQGILKGEWFGISCMTSDNFCFYFQNRLIQTGQTGGQWYSDTSYFSIPCFSHLITKQFFLMRNQILANESTQMFYNIELSFHCRNRYKGIYLFSKLSSPFIFFRHTNLFQSVATLL